MPGKVYKTAMSTLSTSHTLIAVGTEDVQVRLCDITSGAFAHTLSGHRGMSCQCSHLKFQMYFYSILFYSTRVNSYVMCFLHQVLIYIVCQLISYLILY
jgi:hypothetical protein